MANKTSNIPLILKDSLFISEDYRIPLLEGKIQAAILNELQTIYAQLCPFSFRGNSGSISVGDYYYKGMPSGFPDIFGIYKNGRFFGIEVKRTKGWKISPSQIETLSRIRYYTPYIAITNSAKLLPNILDYWENL